MLHILDANVLITANRQYYPLDRVPEFWEWLVHMGAAGLLKMPREMVEEIREGNDDLAKWLSEEQLDALLLDEEADIALVRVVTERGYADDLDDTETPRLGNDPFLIAYALRDPVNRCVVTTEVSKPTRQRANRHIPDVCMTLGVRCIHSFEMVRSLDFSTSWRSRL